MIFSLAWGNPEVSLTGRANRAWLQMLTCFLESPHAVHGGIDQHVLHASKCEQAGVACKPYLRWSLQGTLPFDTFLVDFMFPHIYIAYAQKTGGKGFAAGTMINCVLAFSKVCKPQLEHKAGSNRLLVCFFCRQF
jgi:hypothetical protein